MSIYQREGALIFPLLIAKNLHMYQVITGLVLFFFTTGQSSYEVKHLSGTRAVLQQGGWKLGTLWLIMRI